LVPDDILDDEQDEEVEEAADSALDVDVAFDVASGVITAGWDFSGRYSGPHTPQAVRQVITSTNEAIRNIVTPIRGLGKLDLAPTNESTVLNAALRRRFESQ